MKRKPKNKSKILNNDEWLRRNFEYVIDKFAGGYILIGNGRILYTDKDGSPRELAKMAKSEYPGLVPLFFRVPYPHEFICALKAR